ncbi:MAG: hypothetical protein K9K38_02240 [Rhodoferax sp.]|nr:hypothetical protein [Rhodoferax sp.]MCF8208212.1 hypothetical protein [Rhodoferax sp.]
MTKVITESDWKRFRKVYDVALERFCKQILAEIDTVSADGSKSFHQRYLGIFKIIERRDRELVNVFDSPRRSTAVMQIVALHGLGLLTEDELHGFSEAIVAFVKLLDDEHRT